MLTQLYKLLTSEDNIKNAKPAQFVFKNNDSDEVCGFIVDVSNEHIKICLFEPTELYIDGMINISADVEDWPKLLLKAIDKNPKMRKHWLDKVFKEN